jgi:DNA modification methylase
MVDLSEEEEELALITLDPITAMAEADKDMLNDLIERCKTDNQKVKDLLQNIAEKEKLPIGKKVAEEDDYEPPAEIETDIVRGDIYQLGRHRVMCGDSTSREDVERLMNGKKADMVFTDPPYGVSIGKKNQMLNSFQKAGRNLTEIENDALPEKELYEMLKSAFINTREHSADHMTFYVTAPQGGSLGMMMMMMMSDSGLPARHVLNWVKNSPTFSVGRLDYDYQHEPILYGWLKNHTFYGAGEYTKSTWFIDKPREAKEHPTMKPVALVVNAVLNSSIENHLILDPFLGSGTTLIACEQLDRICYGMEISPQYCEVICQRWEKLTGEKREKIIEEV